jgi:transaldolase
MNPVKALEQHGQSVWLDFLARGFVAKGDLQRLIDTDGVKGVTSNPSIFEKAIGSSDEYDGAIGGALKKADLPVAELFEHLAVEDIQHAADALRPVYDRLKGADGFVSLEVSPYLAMDTKGTIAEAERLWKDVHRKNLMVKVPATPEGLPAIEYLIGEGISINITLLFSQDVYVEVAKAYLAGLEKYVAAGGDPSHVASVASFFVSRIDSAVDKQLDEKIARANDPSEKERLAALKGKVAIANAKTAALAVGLDRHQEQGVPRRALCRGADRPQYRQYRATGDARRLPRSRQAARQPRGKSRGCQARPRRARKVRHLARCDHYRAGQGRRQTVCGRRRQALWRRGAQARGGARPCY